MADFTNRQLADIISVVAEKISKDLSKHDQISKTIAGNLVESNKVISGLDSKIEILKNTPNPYSHKGLREREKFL